MISQIIRSLLLMPTLGTKTYLADVQISFEVSTLARTPPFAIWETQSSTDADYKIWLVTQDELEHTSIKVRVDNYPPNFGLESTIDNHGFLKQAVILARVADIHLHSYCLGYATDLAPNEWLEVYVKGDLYKTALLPEPEMRIGGIQQEWEVPVKERQTTDFLTPSNSDSVDLSFAFYITTM